MAQCHWHPGVEANVSCPECGRYMCPKDMVDTPVGYKCKECGRQRITLGGVKPGQLLRAAAFALPAALLLAPLSRFIPFFFLGVFLFGGLVGEAARRGAGGHRTWQVAGIAAACAAVGALASSFLLGFDPFLALGGPAIAAVYVTSWRWF
ncbi:MAG: hypothetical protein Q7W30_02775 [Coriobacteriia bacterium]|nr:hypothetical protein [Coriobacteriia bacterium]